MKTKSNISTDPYYKKYHLLLKKCIDIKITNRKLLWKITAAKKVVRKYGNDKSCLWKS